MHDWYQSSTSTVNACNGAAGSGGRQLRWENHPMTSRPWTIVTGGAGYIGSLVVDELLARGTPVRVLDTLLHGSVPSLLGAWGRPGFEFLRGDVRDPQIRRAALA